MTENLQTPTVAQQPNPPGDGSQCFRLCLCPKCGCKCPCPEDGSECLCPKCKTKCLCPPKLEDAPYPKAPHPCPTDCCCKCDKPGSSSSCLDDLVEAQAGDAGASDRAKLKAELAKLVETTRTARQEYTRDIYVDLLAWWKKQDDRIVDLLRRLECSVSCWKCILECHVCPLLNELYYSEKLLYDKGKLYDHVYDLYDTQHWLTSYRDDRERTLNRIKDVVKAWASPATTIKKVLGENDKLIDDCFKLIGLQPGKAIYDMFFRLIPLHLAIAPPADDENQTGIDKKYTDLCNCGRWTPDDCCGPNVGKVSFQKRLVPPQAYLINPDDYFELVCCLLKHRYEPAANAVIEANIEIDKLKSEIDRHVKKIGPGWQAEFEKNAKAAIPSVVDCCKYEHKDGHDCDKKKDGQEGPKQKAEYKEKQDDPIEYDQAGDGDQKDQS